ncbi:unnamed protein product [Strongylus vulgaris]|uniref:Uncharacterized protein n=1 Tax=Strongylus vulgaris TaxID=40348 RepID=A0A3P7J5X1_STRVU|nr:unnamed protein product [Strongylus vulgaris]
MHRMLEKDTDLDGATAAWMAEPAFTRTTFAGRKEGSGNQNSHGTIIKQFYEPFGYPFEVPCYSSIKEGLGLPTAFHKLTKRHFALFPSQWILGKVDSFLTEVVEDMVKFKETKLKELAQKLCDLFRSQISPDSLFLESVVVGDFKPWATLTCAAVGTICNNFA